MSLATPYNYISAFDYAEPSDIAFPNQMSPYRVWQRFPYNLGPMGPLLRSLGSSRLGDWTHGSTFEASSWVQAVISRLSSVTESVTDYVTDSVTDSVTESVTDLNYRYLVCAKIKLWFLRLMSYVLRIGLTSYVMGLGSKRSSCRY